MIKQNITFYNSDAIMTAVLTPRVNALVYTVNGQVVQSERMDGAAGLEPFIDVTGAAHNKYT